MLEERIGKVSENFGPGPWFSENREFFNSII